MDEKQLTLSAVVDEHILVARLSAVIQYVGARSPFEQLDALSEVLNNLSRQPRTCVCRQHIGDAAAAIDDFFGRAGGIAWAHERDAADIEGLALSSSLAMCPQVALARAPVVARVPLAQDRNPARARSGIAGRRRSAVGLVSRDCTRALRGSRATRLGLDQVGDCRGIESL